MKKSQNIDLNTVESFGDEWGRFDQTGMSEEEAKKIFEGYFSIFEWDNLPDNPIGFDMGCGSGRWAKWVAPKVSKLHCIDPSNALEIAKKNLNAYDNIHYHKASVDSVELEDSSQDFGYSLGVLHHIPNTAEAIQSCSKLLKPKAPMLLYLYYAFDNRSFIFKLIWQTSNFLRRLIHPLPSGLKHFVTDVIATLIYWPLAKFSKVLSKIGVSSKNIPLSFYQHHSFYTMRTDARDRFGTPLEQRFSKDQIYSMMENAGFEKIQFCNHEPYWCVIGYKK
jgi:ubiquinone/menaquinone biosynthesis C-methylase UbiE